MIGDKNPDLRLPDCEFKEPKRVAWKCPYAGIIDYKGQKWCVFHAKEQGWKTSQ